jgi:hypothetical protein
VHLTVLFFFQNQKRQGARARPEEEVYRPNSAFNPNTPSPKREDSSTFEKDPIHRGTSTLFATFAHGLVGYLAAILRAVKDGMVSESLGLGQVLARASTWI